MSWADLSERSWQAARHLQRVNNHRGSVNRAYYAAFSAITHEARKHTHGFAFGYEHPPHRDMGRVIKRFFVNMTRRDRNDLRDALRRLYEARVEADYRANVTLDGITVRNAMRDARFVMESVGLL